MKTKISPREWEAISAYLDGQLAPRDRTRLEARLERESELRSAMEEMRRVRVMLRSQPKLRAPRNFTLTPQMVGKRPVPRAYPAFRLAAALSSVLLVLVLIGDFFTGAPPVSSGLQYPLNDRQAEIASAPQQPAPEGIGEDAESADVEEKALRASELAGEAATEEAQPEAAAMAEPAEEPAAEPPAMLMAAPTETVESTPAAEAFSAQEAYPPIEADPAESAPAAPTPAEEALETAPTTDSDRQPLWSFDQSALRIIEVVLVLLALGTGLAALYLRRAAGG